MEEHFWRGSCIKKWLRQEGTFEACITANNGKNLGDKKRYVIDDRQNKI